MIYKVIPIHGMPEANGADPQHQLKPLLDICRTPGITIENQHTWIDRTNGKKELAAIFRLLGSEEQSFVKQYVTKLDPWLSNSLRTLPVGTKAIIFAFSAGGALFYEWICTARNEQIRCISMALVVAAPHKFVGTLNFETRKRGYPINEPNISPETIVTKLKTAGTTLKVVLGEKDEMVPPDTGRFSDPFVTQVVIPDASHTGCPPDSKAILEHPDLHALLRVDCKRLSQSSG